ncbi:MAG: hypothetical protein IK095_07570, partial [Oscillospiraceae bacterium]|nr:hypothetical protein [Oscillospiraceae bacterium]
RRARRAGREVPVYLPIEGEGFWLCACGHPARAGQDCPFCGESFEMVQSELSQKVLEAAQQRAVKARAAQRAAALGKRRDALVAAREQAEIRRKDGLYDQAMTEIQRDTIESLTGAIGSFRSIPGWKDADEQLARCQARIDELKAKAEEERQEAERKAAEEAQAKKNRKLTIVIAAAVAACIALALLISNFVVKPVKYNKAAGMLEEGRYAEAVAAFDAMGTYRDARARCAEAMNGLRRQYRQQGDQYLAQGDEVQAAICYLRAGERLLSRRAYDFESKLAVTHGTSAAVSRDGMFYYASNYKSRDRSAVAGIASISVLDMRYGIAGIGEDGKILIEDPFGLLGMGTGNEKLQRALDWSKVRQMTCRYGELVALSEDGTLRGIFSDDAEALIQPPTNVSWLIGSRHDAVWTLDSSDDLCWTAYVKGTRCNFDLSSFTSLKRFEFLSSGIVGITSDGQLVHSVDSTKRASFRWPFSDDEKAVDLAVSGSWVFVLREDGTVTPGYCGKIAAEDASKFAGWTKPIETQTSSWRKILYVRQVYGGVIGVDIDGVVHFVSTENTRAPDGVLTQHIEPGVSALMGQSTGIVYSAGYLYTYDHREALNVIVLCEDGTLRSLGTGKYITLEGKYPNYTPKIHLDGNYDNVSNWKLW